MAESSGGDGATPRKRPPSAVVFNLPANFATPPLSVRRHIEHLQPIRQSKIRWFYQEEKKWVEFDGKDSLVIEKTYRLAN